MPVGFKNNTEGNIKLAIDGIISSRTPHTFLGINQCGKVDVIESLGNPYTHLVLRGSDQGANYDKKSLSQATFLQKNSGIDSKILIDCTHGNSKKIPRLQEETFLSIEKQLIDDSSQILGMMLESHIEEGTQPFQLGSKPLSNRSITDPCISWETTERLILGLYTSLRKSPLITV